MTNKLPCEVIQDLFPSYIDGLTSDVTNHAVEGHVEECTECKQILEAMKEPYAEQENAADSKEIDFLKKTRRKTRRIVVGSIAAVVILLLVFVVRIFFVGNEIYGDGVACEVQVSGNQLKLSGITVDEALGISAIDYTEKEGVVTVSFKVVKESPFHKGEFYSEYTAADEITQVRLGNRIVWDHGTSVSAIASAVFNTRHAYIGDMSANAMTARALNMENYLGTFTNELQTSREPYEWKLLLDEEISSLRQKEKESSMRSHAYILLAVIDNLGVVSYEYMVEGERVTISITEEEASDFAGQNIKTCGKEVLALQSLITKTNLDTYAYIKENSDLSGQSEIRLDIANNIDEAVESMEASYYLDGKLCGTQCTLIADGSAIGRGDIISKRGALQDRIPKEQRGCMPCLL